MTISNWSVKNRTVVVVFCLGITLAGILSYVSFPLEAFPEVEIPFIMVTTRYEGVAPLDVEKSVTVKIEDELKGLSNTRHVSSASSEGFSMVVVEFEPEEDMDVALRKVKDRVDRVKLPSDIPDSPSVTEISSSDFPVVSIVLGGNVGLPLLKQIAEDYKVAFEAVPGVIEAEIIGGLEREITVAVDMERLNAYNLPIMALGAQVTAENQSVSGGSLNTDAGRYQLRVPGEFLVPEEAERLVVAVVDNAPVYLDDVATVEDGYKDQTSRTRLNRASSVSINIKKRSGSNVVNLIDEVDALLVKMAPSLPRGVKTVKINDQAKFVKWLVKDLENNLATGFVLVMIVVFLAMGFRNALLVSISIPLSMLISFVALDAFGVSLNMIVLFSMTLALGMLVDNAIVIIENIYRYMQAGVGRIEAAKRATAEVAWPVIGSAATTIMAFAPLLFWPGIMGKVFKFLPMTVIITLLSCLFVALVINPALAAIFMPVRKGMIKLSADEVEHAGEKPVISEDVYTQWYVRILRWAVKSRISVVSMAFFLAVISFQLWLLIVGPRMDFMSDIDPDTVHIEINTPEGASLEYNDEIVKEVERYVAGGAPKGVASDLVDIENTLAKASTQGGGIQFGAGSSAANVLSLTFRNMDQRTQGSKATTDILRKRLDNVIPGAEVVVKEEAKGPPTGAPINIEVRGEELTILAQIADTITKELEKITELKDIRTDFKTGVPTVRVRVDRNRAALAGLNTFQVGFAIQVAFKGLKISTFRQGGEDFDIVVRLPETARNDINTLESFMLPTPQGTLLPLTNIADIVYEGGYSSINRRDFMRTITITASVDNETFTDDQVRRMAMKHLDEYNKQMENKGQGLPPGYEVKFTGQLEFQKETAEFFSKAGLIAVLSIAIILVMIFNSVTQPFIIMSVVLLAMGTAFLGLAISGLPFILIMSGLGLISLAGVVVNNGIVLVDYTNKLRERGYSLDDAVVFAGATRLRPVVLTAFTTILGLVPIVSGVAFDFHDFTIAAASESSQWWTPMATCVIFGLLLATLLTLIAVPALYHFIESKKAAPQVELAAENVPNAKTDVDAATDKSEDK